MTLAGCLGSTGRKRALAALAGALTVASLGTLYVRTTSDASAAELILCAAASLLCGAIAASLWVTSLRPTPPFAWPLDPEDDGGFGDDDDDRFPPMPPGGDIEFDWDSFERGFREYASA